MRCGKAQANNELDEVCANFEALKATYKLTHNLVHFLKNVVAIPNVTLASLHEWAYVCSFHVIALISIIYECNLFQPLKGKEGNKIFSVKELINTSTFMIEAQGPHGTEKCARQCLHCLVKQGFQLKWLFTVGPEPFSCPPDRPVDTAQPLSRLPTEKTMALSVTSLLSCVVCLKAGEVLWCGGCNAVTYCGPACQKIGWKMHKRDCKKL